MHTIALFGAGKIGEAICALLSLSGRYTVRVCDNDFVRVQAIASQWPHAEPHQLILADDAKVDSLLKGTHAVISALPFHCNQIVARAAVRNGTALAPSATSILMPQCGLAPGFISIAGNHLGKMFDELQVLKLRVGALPIYPSNRLKYNLTWSTEGLVNEYGNVCEVIHNGKKATALPLEGLERFSLDGSEYEAFNTSGGLGSLCETLSGKVKTLNYKTIRYPGHRDLIAFLMLDLRFNEDRDTLVRVFERSLGSAPQDKCIILVEATGMSKGKLIQRTYASTVYNAALANHHFSAIQLTTASGICTPMDLVLSGKFGSRNGLVCCEEISLPDFLNNEFGKYYKDEKALAGLSA